jgi:Spy/CpxP family protein refolding chaperone
MDAFTIAAQMLPAVELTSSQLAQLRAINRNHQQQLYALQHQSEDDAESSARPESPFRAGSPVTDAHDADLDAVLTSNIRAILTPEQRSALDRSLARAPEPIADAHG